MYHDAADTLTRMYQVGCRVDLIESHDIGGLRIDLDIAGHLHVDDLGNVGAAFGNADRSSAPAAPGDELERAGREFYNGQSYTINRQVGQLRSIEPFNISAAAVIPTFLLFAPDACRVAAFFAAFMTRGCRRIGRNINSAAPTHAGGYKH